MLDFIKFSTHDIDIINYFKTNPLLEWMSNEDKFNRYDPEIINTKDKYQFKGIIFCFYPKELKINFLPHYYFNDNLHNANDFNIVNCIKIILEFKNTFEIDWQKLKIINLEFGVNIVPPICIKDLITFLSYHEQHEFKDNPDYKFSKQSHSSKKKTGRANNNKIIKAYAKGIQFPEFCDINTFRFEAKSRESAYINKLKIFNLYDLLNVNVYDLLIEKLIQEFQNVLILYDKIDFANLNSKEVTKLNRLLNPSHWYRIKQDNKRNAFNKEKIKYNKLLDKTGNHLKKQLEKILFEKLELLKKGAISTPQDINKKGAISILYNSRICTYNTTQTVKVKNSICPVTGLNLCNEKEGAKYALTTTLKKLKESDPTSFELVKLNLLNGSRKKPKFEQSEMLHLTKQIRNNYFNSFKIKQQGYNQPLNYFQHLQLNFLSTLRV